MKKSSHAWARAAFAAAVCLVCAGSLGGARQSARADAADPAPSPPAVNGPTTKYGVEIPSLRTRFGRTYQSKAGSFVAVVSPASVNFKDKNGGWQPIDTSLVGSSGRHVNKANRFGLSLPDNLAAAPVRLDLGSAFLTQQLRGASDVAGVVSGSTETYPDVLPATTAAYMSGPDQLTELLKLASTAAPKSFTFDIKSSGLTAKIVAGLIELRDASGKTVFTLPAPEMTDAAGATSGAIAVDLARSGSGYALTLTPDRKWLTSSGRKFPVTIDPSFTAGGDTADCYINSATPTTSFCGVGTNLDVGSDGNSTSRSLLYFDLTGEVPGNAIMLDADLQLHLQSALNSTQAPLSLFRATTSWVAPTPNPQNTTWNNAQGSTPWTTPGGDYAGAVNTAPTMVGNQAGTYDWRFTQQVQRWLDGEQPNNGVILKGDPEGTTNLFHFGSNGDSNQPQLIIRYEYALGDRALYTYDRHAIDDRLGMATNVATGNLLLSANDLHVAGTGIDEYVARYFNSLSSGFDVNGSGDFNYQWQMGTGNDVFFSFYPDGSAAYYGPSGYAVPFVKTANGYLSPTALDATLTKNANGTYTLTAHGDSVSQNFDANGRLTSVVDQNSNTISFAYTANSSSGNGYVLSSITDTQGRTTSFIYNSSAHLTQFTDPAGRLYKYAYSSTTGALISSTDPNNKVTSYTYTSGVLTKVTDPNLNAISFAYDLSNRVTKITRGTSIWKYTYNTGNTVATDPDLHTTTYTYDGLGRVTKIVDGLGNTTFSTPSTGSVFNDDSKLLSFTNGIGGSSSFGYDTTNENRSSSQSPTGATSHSAFLNPTFKFYPTSYTDPQNNTWNYAYDTHGNLTSQQRSGQAAVSFTYNTNGTVATATNGNGNVTSYGYDIKGNLTTITPPAPLGQITLTYDSLSRIATAKDGKGQTTSYTYDGLDRATKTTYSDTSTVTYVYDANGNMTSQADANGTDAFTYDSQNRLTKETLPGAKTNTYTYDLAGNLASFADAGGTVTYNYNATNELSSLTDPNAKQTTFVYDNGHGRTQTNYANGVSQYTTRDLSGRVTSIIGKKPASNTVLTSLSYSYAASGQDTGLRQTATDNVAAQATTYAYDFANRLVSAISPSASYQYAYDADGNRLSATTNGVTTNATYDAADELTQSGTTAYTSDANGNLLNTSATLALTYNPKNQTTAAGSTSFNYLGAGQTQRLAAGPTSFQNSALGLDVQTDGSGPTYFTRDSGGVLISERLTTGTYYYLTDATGSTIALTDASGATVDTYAYDPYGKPIASTGTIPNPYRFAGQYYDPASGLYKIGARYYDPASGRWLQRDPMADPTDPEGASGYGYAGDDPVNNVDPTGLRRSYLCDPGDAPVSRIDVSICERIIARSGVAKTHAVRNLLIGSAALIVVLVGPVVAEDMVAYAFLMSTCVDGGSEAMEHFEHASNIAQWSAFAFGCARAMWKIGR